MFLDRVIGVLRLDANTYEEIEADETATGQAAMVVLIVAVIGGLISGGVGALTGDGFFGNFLSQLIGAFFGWFIWSAATYYVGTSFFEGKATMGEMLRVLGFAQAPGILGVVPVCGAFIGWLWTLACTFIAIRQGLDLDNTKALLTAIVAFIAILVFNFVVGIILVAIGIGAGILGGVIP